MGYSECLGETPHQNVCQTQKQRKWCMGVENTNLCN